MAATVQHPKVASRAGQIVAGEEDVFAVDRDLDHFVEKLLTLPQFRQQRVEKLALLGRWHLRPDDNQTGVDPFM